MDATRELLAGDLVGIYLHGSLATGCFNPATSDLDLLVVTAAPMTVARKVTTVAALLALSGSPSPIEVSYLVQSDLRRWVYPPPYDLHYSEAWRARFERDLASGVWSSLNDPAADRRDPDLAAHITGLRVRGVCLIGHPTEAVFPTVPADDFLSSVLTDLGWSLEPARFAASPGYAVLNHCRVYRHLVDGSVCSKAEGAEWARGVLPQDLVAAVDVALTAYRSVPDAPRVNVESARQVIEFLRDGIARGLSRRGYRRWIPDWPAHEST